MPSHLSIPLHPALFCCLFLNDLVISCVKHLRGEKHMCRMCFGVGVEQESRPSGGTTVMNQEAVPGRHSGSVGPSSRRLGHGEAWHPIKRVSSLLPLSPTVVWATFTDLRESYGLQAGGWTCPLDRLGFSRFPAFQDWGCPQILEGMCAASL